MSRLGKRNTISCALPPGPPMGSQWVFCSGLSSALFHTWQQHQVLPGCCYLKPSGNPMNYCQPRVGMSEELAHTCSVPPSTRQASAFSFLCGIKAFPHRVPQWWGGQGLLDERDYHPDLTRCTYSCSPPQISCANVLLSWSHPESLLRSGFLSALGSTSAQLQIYGFWGTLHP